METRVVVRAVEDASTHAECNELDGKDVAMMPMSYWRAVCQAAGVECPAAKGFAVAEQEV